MFKKGGFDSYELEASIIRLAESKLKNITGIEIKQGDFLQIGFDENENKL